MMVNMMHLNYINSLKYYMKKMSSSLLLRERLKPSTEGLFLINRTIVSFSENKVLVSEKGWNSSKLKSYQANFLQ